MPSSEQEPENYSIDDMMDRLRSRGEGGRDGEAELVVREDGTQLYRMRKRKRRSHQPKKEKEKRQRRFRVAQVVAAVGLVATTGLALLGSVIYLNSTAYQESILSRIRTWTGAEPHLTQFRMSPVNAAADSVELVWPESSMLRNLKLNGVRADLRISSIFGGAWKGSEMTASGGGTLVLRRPEGVSAGTSPERKGDCPFQFRYRCPSFNVLMGAPESPALRLQSTEVSIAVLDPAATTANLQFEGGTLTMAGWGDFGLKFASFQIEPAGARLATVRLAPGGTAKGEIEIFNPQQVPLALESGESEMAMRLDRIPLSTLLGPAFGKSLNATVETREGAPNGTLQFKGGEAPSFSYRIPFHATATSESSASLLPLFGILAEQVDESWYQSPTFDLGFSGTVVRGQVASGVEDLRMEARGRLMITGQVMADASGVLDGSLEIGLPSAALTDASVPFRLVFRRKEGGHAWATVRISGTGTKPVDDLQQQLDEATASAAPASGGKDILEDEFFNLTPEKR
jgi:hypothetical protein